MPQVKNIKLIDVKDARNARLMIFRQFLTIPFGFARAIAVLPLLTPDLVFITKIITTWFGYLPRITLGTTMNLSFYYPAAEANNDWDLCKKYQLLAWRFSLFGSIVGVIVGMIISLFYLEGSFLLLLAIWGGTITINNYNISNYQGKGLFSKFATVDIVSTISGFLFSFTGLLLFGFDGYLWGTVLSLLLVLLLGKDNLFPPKIALPKNFIKSTILNGSHLWANGFLADLVKTFDITLLAFVGSISANFAGQYAVAMTLTGILDKVVTSVAHVFQRKVVKELSIIGDNGKNYSIIYEFVLLDILLFVIAGIFALCGIHVIIYFLPKYSEIIHVFPFLFLAALLLRFRFYPGIAFKSDVQFFTLHWGHVIHMAAGACSFITIAYTTNGAYKLSISQVIGAAAGSLYVWSIFYLKKEKSLYFYTRVVWIILLISGWIVLCNASVSDIIQNLLVVILGGSAIIFVIYLLFKNAFKLLISTFIHKKLK